ncbi:MAG TPA: dihydropteroate synthase [Gemmatimonadaceae bacterium]|nr:dihydropteroate synthase [Gemmatimonadaceae bacterium]
MTFAWPSKSQRPTIFGILNVTPDSFSDGGNFFSTEAAIAQASRMISEGADAIDIGGESTRPGAQSVHAREELKRVLPAIRAIRSRWSNIAISIDTVKAEVARAALAEGASIVNDVSGMSLDPEMPQVCAEAGCSVVLMHSRGSVADMASYDNAVYGSDAVGEILSELEESVQTAQRAGIHPGRIALDPGIGFSKRTQHSLAALVELPRIVALGYPVFVGASRKRVIAELIRYTAGAGTASAGGTTLAEQKISNEDRDMATVGVNVVAFFAGARIFRVHSVRANRLALDTAWALTPEESELLAD